MLFPPVLLVSETDDPLLMVAPVIPSPPKRLVPPLVLTPDWSAGCEAPDTTSPLPPLDGVWKAKVSLPTVRAYQVLGDHEDV